MRYIYLFITIFTVVFSSCSPDEPTASDYPDADALYLNLKKTFILNEDGSIIQKTEKKQKLFTYRAFHSLYGDTRITYNPDFQKINVEESYTVMSDGKRVDSPQNAYNEVLPRNCTNSKAYSHIRELVISHTALERNAVINCKYQITTVKDILPYLMGNELLVQSCPVKEMSIIIQVPKGTELNYTLYGSDTKPHKTTVGNNIVYEWKFEDLPQHLTEPGEYIYSEKLPRLIFSTQESRKKLIDAISNQPGFMINDMEKMPPYISNALKGLETPMEIALKIQQIVTDEVNLVRIPEILTGFMFRTPKLIWESNSATATEKAILMSSLMKEAGINNFICMKYPSILNGNTRPFILNSVPVIIFNSEDGSLAYLSPTNKNKNYAEIKQPEYACIPVGYKIEQVVDFKPQNGEISASGNLTLTGAESMKGFFVATFSGSANPFMKIKTDKDFVNNLIPGWNGITDSLNIDRLKVVFNGERNISGKIRGNNYFVPVPASTLGITSKHLLPLKTERLNPLYFGHPLKESYTYNITVPRGYKLINSASEKIKTPAGDFTVEIRQNENIVKYKKIIDIKKTVIPENEYAYFRNLITKWNLEKYNTLVFETD
ncbi:MAG: DUF3857 domain-containing protein [Chlorobi bacterium]|nr:DUF3857 domain-containing protein [Chlorobiota bacterium]